MYKRTLALAAIITAGAAGSANAAAPYPFPPTVKPVGVGATSGSVSTPSLNALGDATIKLGPAGTMQLDGIKRLQVTVHWSNALGDVQPILGDDCTVDSTARIRAGQHTAVKVAYSFTRRGARSSVARSFNVRALRGGPWDFSVCYDAR